MNWNALHRQALFSGLVCLLSTFAMSGVADARLVEWHLQNLVFDDGGTAGGHVTLDFQLDFPTRPAFFVYDIETRGGQLPSVHYTPADSVVKPGFSVNASGFLNELLFFSPDDKDFVHQVFSLFWAGPLPPDGGVVPLVVCQPTGGINCPGVEETGDLFISDRDTQSPVN